MELLTDYLTGFLNEGERTALRGAAADVASLPDRLTANEALWGPECRPELRERLADARATVERLRRLATDRAERDATVRFDAERPAFNRLTLVEGGREHLAWNDNGKNPICGSWLIDDPEGNQSWIGGRVFLWEALDGEARLGASNRCKRCTAGVRAWWNND